MDLAEEYGEQQDSEATGQLKKKETDDDDDNNDDDGVDEQTAIENERDMEVDGKSGDEDDDEDEDTGNPEVKTTYPTQNKRASFNKLDCQKEANAEPFDSFEFGVAEGKANESSSSKETAEELHLAADRWMPLGAPNTAIVNKSRRFICIDYPGFIQNKAKALTTLGGIDRITKAKAHEGRLEMNLRPDDPFSKPAIGFYGKASNLLIKCKRRKVPEGSASTSKGDGYEYKIEVLGIVEGIVDFKLPADYQYLPIFREKDGSLRELLSDIQLKFEDDRHGYLNRDVPLYAPPFNFTRHERPAKYYFRPDDDEIADHTLIARKVRYLGTQWATFWDETVPQVANESSMLNLKRYNEEKIKFCRESLQQLFAKRPIWTRMGIVANTNPEDSHYHRHVLPTIAYFIQSGAWGKGWCKLGYDPRKHPVSKKYQIIDFRLRKKVQISQLGSTCLTQGNKFGRKQRFPYDRDLNPEFAPDKEESPLGQTESGPPGEAGDASASGDATPTAGGSSDGVNLKYQYVPWKIPPYRNMLFQACDVFEDGVQKMLHQNDGQEKECTERDGWCVPDFTDRSRDILMAHMEILMS